MRGKFFIPTLLLTSSFIMCALLFPLSWAQRVPISVAAGLSPEAPMPQDIDCATAEEVALPILARAIEAQAEGKPYAVRVAFGAVILNRVRSGGFGSSVSAVLSGAGIYPADGVEASDRSVRAAKEALAGTDPTFGAIFILSDADPSLPKYKDRIRVKIDGLVFIR